MTAKRQNFSLVCLPPDEGGLIAIGGYIGGHIDVVESLDGVGATEWRRLAPLPDLCLLRVVVFTSSRGFWLWGVPQRVMHTPQPRLHLLPQPQEALDNGSP